MFLDGTQVISTGKALIRLAVAQSHANYFYFIERVRGMRNTSGMGNTKLPLTQTHPVLAKEAYGWDPETENPKSHEKVSWQCKKGHVWQASFNNRSRHDSGCPFCSNRKLLKGFNDLQTLRPDVAAEADGWDPSEVLSGSHSKVSWKCSKAGHAFTTKIESRTVKNTGCPICANQKLLVGVNDLATTHLKIAGEALGWDPTQVMASSKSAVDWKCSNGHVQKKSPSQRTKTVLGCTVCSGRTLSSGENDFASTHPELALEAFGWDPTKVTFGSPKNVKWKCKIGHIWNAKINARTSAPNSACPICQNLKVQIGFNDLATTHPEIAKEAFGWDPQTVTSSSIKKMKWRCSSGHVEESTVTSRAKSKRSCSICGRRRVTAGENDLATTHPELSKEVYGWDPTLYHAGSPAKKAWVCGYGHKWQTEIRNRADRGAGCPYCSDVLVTAGKNDLLTIYPKIGAEAFGWDPSTVFPGTKAQKDWICSLGHKWKASVQARTNLGSDCPVCANQKVLAGFNDFLTFFPDLAKEAHEWDPSTVIAGSKRKVSWKCALGHIWKAAPGVRSAAGTGCPICSNNQLLTGFNDLATTNPALASEANGWDPSKVISGSLKKLSWKCPEGHTWFAHISSRKNGNGCPFCSKSGFNPGKPGWLYFLEHPDWEMLQIGITNFPDARIGTHKSKGWILLEIRGPMDGLLTQKWETGILQMLRRHNAELSPTKIVGKFDGYTEAWMKNSMQVESIKEMMELVRDEEMTLGSKKKRNRGQK